MSGYHIISNHHFNNTLPETNSKRPWKWAVPKGSSSSNHWFSGAKMLVSGRVLMGGAILQIWLRGYKSIWLYIYLQRASGFPERNSARSDDGWCICFVSKLLFWKWYQWVIIKIKFKTQINYLIQINCRIPHDCSLGTANPTIEWVLVWAFYRGTGSSFYSGTMMEDTVGNYVSSNSRCTLNISVGLWWLDWSKGDRKPKTIAPTAVSYPPWN